MEWPNYRLPHTEELVTSLVKIESPSPRHGGCLDIMMKLGGSNGMTAHYLPCDEVENGALCYGDGDPAIIIPIHLDCVPAGKWEEWTELPFGAAIKNGNLYGRGASDMKGPAGATLLEVLEFIRQFPDHKGQIWILLNPVEEGIPVPADLVELSIEDRRKHFATNGKGAGYLAKWLHGRGITGTYIFNPEPIARESIGDRIGYGSYGALNGFLTCYGSGGHTANDGGCTNAIDKMDLFAERMRKGKWRNLRGLNSATPIMHATNILGGSGGLNVIPSKAHRTLNFRIPPGLDEKEVIACVDGCLQEIPHALSWDLFARPYVSMVGNLIAALVQATGKVVGRDPELFIARGSSDNKWFPDVKQRVEFGPTSKWSHHIDELVRLDDLAVMRAILQQLLQNLLT